MLKKLKMPKPKAIEFDETEMGDYADEEESPEEEAAESPEEEAAESEEEEAKEHPGKMSQFSDKDLIAEVKKRGLMSQLEKEMGEESSEEAYV